MQELSKFKTSNKFSKKLLFLILLIVITICIAVTIRVFWHMYKLEVNDFKVKISGLEKKMDFLYGGEPEKVLNSAIDSNTVTAQINEAYILTRTAANILQNTKDLVTAKQLLQLAADNLATLHSPKIDRAKEILSADQSKLEAARMPDTHLIQEKLAMLDKLINVLPAYRNIPIKKDGNNDKHVSATHITKKAWYDKFLNIISDLKTVVKIRKKTDHEINTFEIEIAREQFKLLIEQLRWAAFYNNAEIYQRSISKAQSLLPEVFDIDSESVQKSVAILQELAAIQLKFEVPNIQNSVNALHAILIR